MRQSSEISKLTGFSACLAAGFFITMTGLSGLVNAADPAPAAAMAPMAEAPAAKPVVPGKPKADPAAGEALYSNGDASRGVVACVGCHGANGKSASGAWPKLAAQHAAYITKQLKSYKDGTRANAVMAGMSAALTEQDMVNISAYLVKQEPSLGVAQNKETIELGQSIYRGGIASKGVAACAGCHSPNGAGIPSQYPRQGGQWAEYSTTQLMAFREGTRKNSSQMTSIATKLSDQEMKAVSDYMAGLR
ncbi:c-type cytochrome [Polynucleobacter brandtiae]|uniref:Cytochrome c553 n=1 Tax=Polynucleobacter brandtiae TaxID=1938816 RepID=A0A2M8VRP7_9BURK|nr:c-type cytochrome [Polynucleobacter brandtiae]PJI80145.1 cytochrome c553 [Polynucleobacter brandtiae]